MRVSLARHVGDVSRGRSKAGGSDALKSIGEEQPRQVRGECHKDVIEPSPKQETTNSTPPNWIAERSDNRPKKN